MPASDSYAAVIVTGGSSGIGKSFLEHARNVYPEARLCNLSRRDPHRENPRNAAELKLRHIPCDVADAAELAGATEALTAWLKEVPAGRVLLVNNAGFGGYGTVEALEREHQLGMIDVNVRAVVDLTSRLLPILRARGGAVVTVASTAAFQPTPYLSTYGATKAFVLHWSLGLAEELRGTNVHALAVCPGPTSTDFFRRAGLKAGTVPDALGQTPEQVVAEAFRALRARRTLVVTGWKNKALAGVVSKGPKALVARIAAKVLARVRKGQTEAGT
jgi:uncharacterized protein